MANTTFNQFLQEDSLIKGIEQSGLTEELAKQNTEGDWSEALTADELFKALDCDSDV